MVWEIRGESKVCYTRLSKFGAVLEDTTVDTDIQIRQFSVAAAWVETMLSEKEDKSD